MFQNVNSLKEMSTLKIKNKPYKNPKKDFSSEDSNNKITFRFLQIFKQANFKNLRNFVVQADYLSATKKYFQKNFFYFMMLITFLRMFFLYKFLPPTVIKRSQFIE